MAGTKKTNVAGQPDDYYHYRVYSEGSLTRFEAMTYVRDHHIDYDGIFGICWKNEHGNLEYVHFKEMTEEEIDYLYLPADRWLL